MRSSTIIVALHLLLVTMTQNHTAKAQSSKWITTTIDSIDFTVKYWDDGRDRPYLVQFMVDGLTSRYYYNTKGYVKQIEAGTESYGIGYTSGEISKVIRKNSGSRRLELNDEEEVEDDLNSASGGLDMLHRRLRFDECNDCEKTWDVVCDTNGTMPSGTPCALLEWDGGAVFGTAASESLSIMCDVFMAGCSELAAASACEGQCLNGVDQDESCGISCAVEDPCSPDPCLNGGACAADIGGGHVCSCANNYGGMKCQTDTSSLSDFYISLMYTGTWTTARKQIFEAAAARWAEVVTHVPCTGSRSYPAGRLLISAELKDIDGEGGVLGVAGPTAVGRRCPTISLTGQMIFDIDDIARIEAAGYLEGVVQHEMGHTLGLGVLWGDCNTCFADNDAEWTCDAAREAYNDLAGVSSNTAVQLVELGGSSGTSCSHFDEGLLDDELMTGWVEKTGMPLSKITAGALDDMGYVVNAAKVDEYILPSKRALMSGKEKDDDDYQHHKGLELVGMESTIAVDVVDDKGKVFEVHPGARMRA